MADEEITGTLKGLATAFANIMADTKLADDDSPWLYEVPIIQADEKFIERDRENRKAKRKRQAAFKVKKRVIEERHVSVCDADSDKQEYERQLKRLASKGAAKLFNTVMQFRRSKGEKELTKEKLDKSRQSARRKANAAPTPKSRGREIDEFHS